MSSSGGAMRMRVVFWLSCGAMAASVLAGCGGSSSPKASTAASTPASNTATATAGGTAGASHPAPRSGSTSSSSTGGAASFRTPGGDNSIPDFGGEASSSERHRAVTVLAAFLRARADGQWSEVCTYLTGTIRRQMERLGKSAGGKLAGCASTVASLSGAGPVALRADPLTNGVAAVRIKGKTAFVLFRGPHASKYVMPMQNEDSSWKVTQDAPLRYPIGTPEGTP